ncbi:unnamed protein product [Echinostoma caproni]|uniref:DDE_3 domain-containing protein n=1 Tax=Echinostoma caproni TaxID=27848 RepID=A0A183AZ75_9TREM|nr:unnamed protein product [Echinostoma caproni]
MGLIRPDAQRQRREVPRETMLTATRNERIDNFGPTDNPQLTGKIPTECHNLGAFDQRISRRDRVKPVGIARGRRSNLLEEEQKSYVIVCDNAPCHSEPENVVAGGRVSIPRLAPYSPALTPIEMICSITKRYIKTEPRNKHVKIMTGDPEGSMIQQDWGMTCLESIAGDAKS